ncbi:multiubiquitin domain-containing protein [Sulfuricurvum sp.]|uniref:multiubiquitin domain-containing protein n=1 Tax=Sulfuricurvum sp. TaxID=2025608 RepID=UPI002639F45F|nr:multiubiquitin domain-containing protein [Sulfuricurvum sp.]MDD2783306.1 multiubiquitin domain-containing protein [Sulfuricurvum sp.]
MQEHKVDYDEIVRLSGLIGTDTTSFLISYERGVGNASGNLSQGESIVLKDGMVFNVTNCNRS